MLDLHQLSDIELLVLLKGQALMNDCKLSISEKVVSRRLHAEIKEEIHKRGLEVIPIWL